MNVSLIQHAGFVAKWKRHGLTDEDLQALESTLNENPTVGAVMAGTGGVRKVRFAPPSRHAGKSGGFRVGYAYLVVAGTVHLLALFAKNEQANFTAGQAGQKAELRELMKTLAG